MWIFGSHWKDFNLDWVKKPFILHKFFSWICIWNCLQIIYFITIQFLILSFKHGLTYIGIAFMSIIFLIFNIRAVLWYSLTIPVVNFLLFIIPILFSQYNFWIKLLNEHEFHFCRNFSMFSFWFYYQLFMFGPEYPILIFLSTRLLSIK